MNNDTDLGRVAVITGASSGIGAATARASSPPRWPRRTSPSPTEPDSPTVES